ncbi:MAG: DUF222 domain-containing protein, partial [Burkholderiaceae bacterium]
PPPRTHPPPRRRSLSEDGRHGLHADSKNALIVNFPQSLKPKTTVQKRPEKHAPKKHAAFQAGRISYSKVRALTRVATPQNERDLLEVAFGGTASHVERVVRHYRQVQATLNPAQVFHSRELSCYFDDDGMLVIRGRLTADQGAVFMQALDPLREPPDNNEIDDTFRTTAADALAKMAELSLNTHAGDARTADRYQVRVSVPAETLLRQSLIRKRGDQSPDHGVDLNPYHR